MLLPAFRSSILHLFSAVPSEVREGLNIVALTNTILTIARPGKAPRKSCDLKTALERVIAAKRDAAGAVAAQRILAKLTDM
jgi:hypothetical protein